MQTISLILLGIPVPKARARTVTLPNGRRLTHTPAPTAQAEASWQATFIASGQQPFPPETPLEITVTSYLPRPPSAPKRRVRPITRPDYDNLVKLVTDALQGLAFRDDSQVVDAHIHKVYVTYPDYPRTELVITKAT